MSAARSIAVSHEEEEPSPATHTAPPVLAAPPPARRRGRLLGIAAALALVVGGGALYASRRGLERTDNAQIDAEVTAVPARVGGVVARVHFVENQEVKAGDVLVELDDGPARTRLAQAEASLAVARANADAAAAEARVAGLNATSNRSATRASFHTARVSIAASQQQIAEGEARLAAAEATARQARADLERAQRLFKSGALAQAQYDQQRTQVDATAAAVEQARAALAMTREATDQARSRADEASARARQASDVDTLVQQAEARARAAEAQVEQAKAARDLAALDLAYTKIAAPQDGVISRKSVTVGQMLGAGAPVGQLVPRQATWVTANFKETQVGRMRPGQPAEVEVDAYPGVTLRGEVESFAAGTGSRFTLLPPDNATGNFTKVVQRVATRVRLRDVPKGLVLRPGMSAELTVDTRGAR